MKGNAYKWKLPSYGYRCWGIFLSAGDNQISDTEGRSRKVWLLLAYMIYNRDRTVSQEELVEVLWGKEPRSSNPTSALKTTFHRVRSLLD